jgi:hypothetical protein
VTLTGCSWPLVTVDRRRRNDRNREVAVVGNAKLFGQQEVDSAGERPLSGCLLNRPTRLEATAMDPRQQLATERVKCCEFSLRRVNADSQGAWSAFDHPSPSRCPNADSQWHVPKLIQRVRFTRTASWPFLTAAQLSTHCGHDVNPVAPPRSRRCRFFSSSSSLRTHAWLPRDRGPRARR